MGDFHPEAQVNGFCRFSFIALICNKYSAVFNETSLFFFMSQSYKVYINDKEIFFGNPESVVSKYNKDNTVSVLDKPSADSLRIAIAGFVADPHLQQLMIVSENPKEVFREFRKDYKEIRAAGGLVRDKDMRVLLIFRRGKWDLPKGKIDTDERKKHAALREVREETGLDQLFILSRIAKTYHIYTEKNDRILKKTYWYEMAAINPGTLVPQTEEDITGIRWFEPDKLDEVFSNTFPLVADLLKENLSAQA